MRSTISYNEALYGISMVKKTKVDFVLPTGSTWKLLFPSFYSHNDVDLPSLKCTKQKRQTDNRAFRSSRWRLPQSNLANKRSAVIQYHTYGIFFCIVGPLVLWGSCYFQNFTSGSRQITDDRPSWSHSWSCRSHRAKYNGFH